MMIALNYKFFFRTICQYYLLLFVLCTYSQNSITGVFPFLEGQHLRLMGFNGFNSYIIDSTMVSQQGRFKLNYKDAKRGMGYLSTTTNNNSYFVVLSSEDIRLQGENLSALDDIAVLQGEENKLFVEYAIAHPKRESALHAWRFLQKLYQTEDLFPKQTQTRQDIEAEIQRLRYVENEFLKKIDTSNYVSWYLPIRKLVSAVPRIAKYQTDHIPNTLEAFRDISYGSDWFYRSGLLKDTIENHFWLLENMGATSETVFKEMCISINKILISVGNKNETRFNEIAQYLFKLLERQSLFKASEYLALKVLTQYSCMLNDNLTNQLEAYRSMKIGKKAPDIVLNGDVFKNGIPIKGQKYLSGIKSKYRLVVFGASWCLKCTEELSELLRLYPKWRSKDVEVVFVSLDTDISVFKSFSSVFPFYSSCDYKQWDAQAVKDYYVFATPTMFLLDTNQKIILRPNSINQVDTWLDYYTKEAKNN